MHSRVKHLSSLKIINEIVSLHNEVWNNSTGIIDLLKNSSDCLVLFDENDHVIGYAFAEEDKKRGFIELQDLVVSPKYQGQSGGKILMRSIMRKYNRIKLIVRESNARLIAFYKNLGFELESVIENYYDISEDGARMSWQKR
ncbi:MAG: GNAT family N-acetyltransferase [Candidatus Aminicenantaceae bacterium]